MKSQRNHYYQHSPRGFSNEVDLYAVPADMISRFETLLPNASRISRKLALQLNRRDGCCLVGEVDYGPGEGDADMIAWAVAGTIDLILEWERKDRDTQAALDDGGRAYLDALIGKDAADAELAV